MTYKPRAGSMPAKLIEFLNINGDKELTAYDIAAKFDVHSLSVHSCLRAAIDGGVVGRLLNDDGEYIYVHPSRSQANPGEASRSPWPDFVSKSPAITQAGAFAVGKPPARRNPTAAPLTDFATVELEDHVPIKNEWIKRDWPSLFSRMKPGQSCILPRSIYSACFKAAASYKSAGLGEFRRKVINDEQFRLWRLV